MERQDPGTVDTPTATTRDRTTLPDVALSALRRFRRSRSVPTATTGDPPPQPSEPAAAADDGRDAEQLVAEIDRLAAENRTRPDPDVQIRLIELRKEAAGKLHGRGGRPDWPPHYTDPYPEVRGALPEMTPDTLDADRVGGAVAHEGAAIVRGLLDPEQATTLRDVIDTVHERKGQGDAAEPAADAIYRPITTSEPMKTAVLRNMVGEQGGIWLADSPLATAVVLDELDRAGVLATFTDHFGQRPFFSMQKSTLRRAPAKWRFTAWHQDGAFLGAEVRTMNVWVALSPCGGERPTPGLELMPRRMEGILPYGNNWAPHAAHFEDVEALAEETPTIIPEFEPGDALIFDERFLHRTYLREDVSEPRYALECWFFCPSSPAPDYLPLLA